MASIIRHRRARDFTVLPNELIRDSSLSFRATGLLSFLLSLPTGTPVDSLSLSRRKREGRDAIRTAFGELIEHGYVTRSKEQGDTGQWTTIIEVCDRAPTPEKPASAEPTSENQALSLSKNERDKTPVVPKGTDPSDFDAFWRLYPRKVGKDAARRAFEKALKRVPVDEVMAGLRGYPWHAVGTFVPNPSVWLNQGRWADELEQPPAPLRSVPRPLGCEGCEHGWVDTPDGMARCPSCNLMEESA